MTDLHDAAEELRRIEAMVAREFAKVDVPMTREVRPAAEELGPIPACRKAVETAAGCVAVVGMAVGYFT